MEKNQISQQSESLSEMEKTRRRIVVNMCDDKPGEANEKALNEKALLEHYKRCGKCQERRQKIADSVAME